MIAYHPKKESHLRLQVALFFYQKKLLVEKWKFPEKN